jgi:hypothetical protein
MPAPLNVNAATADEIAAGLLRGAEYPDLEREIAAFSAIARREGLEHVCYEQGHTLGGGNTPAKAAALDHPDAAKAARRALDVAGDRGVSRSLWYQAASIRQAPYQGAWDGGRTAVWNELAGYAKENEPMPDTNKAMVSLPADLMLTLRDALNVALGAAPVPPVIDVGPTVRTIANGSDLANIGSWKDGEPVELVPGGNYTLSAPLPEFIGAVAIKGNGASIDYTGRQDFGFAAPFSPKANGVRLSGFKIVNKTPPAAGKQGCISLFRPAGSDIAISDVKAVGFSEVVNGEANPDGVTIDNLNAQDLRGHLVYVCGKNWAIRRLQPTDSSDESLIRIENGDNIAIEDCQLVQGTSGGKDSGKSALKVHWGRNVAVRRCTIRGGSNQDIGPLGTSDAKADQRCDGFLMEDCRVFGPLMFQPGVTNATIRNNTFDVTDTCAFIFSGYDAKNDRTVDGVLIEKNLFVSTAQRASVVRLNDVAGKGTTGAKNVKVRGNWLVVPAGWVVSEHGQGSWIHKGIEIEPYQYADNVWPVAVKYETWTDRDVAIVGEDTGGPLVARMTVEQWLGKFPSDRFANATADAGKAAGVGVRN